VTRVDPGIPNLEVEFGDEVFQRSDGRVVAGTRFVVDEETWGQLISGYRCMKCMHVQSEPFPEQCEAESHIVNDVLGVVDWRCPMRMRDDQLRELMQDFGGFEDRSLRDPYDVIDVEQEDWKARSGIWLPGNGT
jgi:hypothetical protein